MFSLAWMPEAILSFLPQLSCHSSRGLPHLFQVAQIKAADGGEVVFKSIHQGDTSGGVELDDRVIGDVIKVFNQGPQTVAVGGNNHLPFRLHLGRDGLLPVRQKADDSILEALGGRQFLRPELGIAGVIRRMPRVPPFKKNLHRSSR